MFQSCIASTFPPPSVRAVCSPLSRPTGLSVLKAYWKFQSNKAAAAILYSIYIMFMHSNLTLTRCKHIGN